MSKQSIFLTPEGYKKLEEELEYLRTVRRQQVAKRLHSAMDEGDLLENAELEDARNEQAFVEGRILELESILKHAVVVEEKGPKDRVGLGSRVTVVEVGREDEPETYTVVGSAEADPIAGRISNESPLGRVLIGKKVGDEVRVNAPDGVLTFRIVAIE